MKLHELKTGMTIKLRNGKVFRVIENVDAIDGHGHQDYVFCNDKRGFMTGDYYNEDMTFNGIDELDYEWDIIEVYDVVKLGRILDLDIDFHLDKLLWVRVEEKELTVDEVSDLLGYKVKIVGEKGE